MTPPPEAAHYIDSGATSTPLSDSIGAPVFFEVGWTPELSEPVDPDWVSDVVINFMAITQLEEDWDGYGGAPIRAGVIQFAKRLLQDQMLDQSPAPQITPVSCGGIILEWQLPDIGLEIEIEEIGDAWVSLSVGGLEPREWPVGFDLSSLADPIAELTRRATNLQR
jgi:hypothetical protein